MAIVVKLTGDLSDLEGKLKTAGIKVQELGEKADKAGGHAGKLTGALGGVSKIAGGLVLGAGILKAPGFLMDAAQAAADDEAATKRLDQTLKNLAATDNMLTFDELKGAVDDLIDKGQKLAFSDDEVRDSLQSLMAATGSADESMVRLAAAQDLARGANIPLAQASKMLGKLNGENVEVFKKLGITLGENATEADALALVQEKFGGQAEAYAKSTAGQFDQAKLAMGEIVEGIGTAVLPILAKVGTVLAENLPAIQEFVGEFSSKISEVLIPALQAFIDFLGPIIVEAVRLFKEEILPAIQSFMDYIQPKLVELGEWVKEQFGKFREYYETDIKPALDNVIAGIQAIIDFVVEHWPEIEKVIKPIMEQVQLAVETAIKVIMGVLGILIDLIGGDFSGAWTKLQTLVGDVWAYIQGTIENTIELIKNLAPLMLAAGKALGEALLEGLKEALSATVGFAGDIGQAVLNAGKGVVNSQVIDRINSALEFSFDTHIPGVGKISINPDNIPRLASGMWDVPGTPGVDGFPAMLAGGEMVVPEPIAEGLRQLSGTPGFSVTTPGATSGGGSYAITIGVTANTPSNGLTAEEAQAALVQLLQDLEQYSEEFRRWFESDPSQTLNTYNLRQIAAGNSGGTVRLPSDKQGVEDLISRGVWTRAQGQAWIDAGYRPTNAGMPDYFDPSVGPPPSIYPTSPNAPGAEGGSSLPTPTNPALGGTGGTASGGGAPSKGGGSGGASDETMLLVLDELKKANILAAKQNDILGQPQAIDFMSRGDPKAFFSLYAPLIADALAQIYRRQGGWQPT